MKTVRLQNDIVVEIIPDYALPVKDWYGEEFASSCGEAPDVAEQGWVYDSLSNTYKEPTIPQPRSEPLTNEELARENAALRTKLDSSIESASFVEECLVEMASIVYA